MSTLRHLPDARWSCNSCGFCCRFHTLGPVEADVVADLDVRATQADWPLPAGEAWKDVRPGPRGDEVHLRKVDGACVFLAPDNRCRVHAAYGSQAKPGFCREFPYAVVSDPLGASLTIRDTCAGFHESAIDGQLLSAQVDDALALARLAPHPSFQPPQVMVGGGASLPLDAWMALEAQLLAGLRELDLEPAGLVAWVRRSAAAAAGAVASVPQPARGRLAARATVEALRITIQGVLDQEQAPSAADEAFTRRLLANVATAGERLTGALPPLSAAARAHVNLLLQSRILSKDFQQAGGLPEGLGLYVVDCLLAQAAAEPDAEGQVGLAAFSAVYTRHVRLTRNRSMVAVLKMARPALVDVYLHAE